jgi:hypothetical protein
MSFFPSSSVIIYGGNFTSISHPTQDAGRFLFPFQALLLTVLIIATAAQVLGKRKDLDSCEPDDYAQADDLRKKHRCRSLETIDGLMVCQQATVVILFHDHAY